MYRFLSLILILISITISGLAQRKGRTVQVSSDSKVISIPGGKSRIPVKANDSDKKDKPGNSAQITIPITSNDTEKKRKVKAEERIENGNLIVLFSYFSEDDKREELDFSPGEYFPSPAGVVQRVLNELKHSINNDYSEFIKKNTKLTFLINGSADSTEINTKVFYNGEFGNRVAGKCQIEDVELKMNIGNGGQISAIEELAFLRAYAARFFLQNEVPVLQKTNNEFKQRARISRFEGGKFRRVAVEMTIHDAFDQ